MIDKYSMLPIVGAKMTDEEKFHISEEERREVIKSARNTGLQQAAEAQAIRAAQTDEMRRKWVVEQIAAHIFPSYEAMDLEEFLSWSEALYKYLVTGETKNQGAVAPVPPENPA